MTNNDKKAFTVRDRIDFLKTKLLEDLTGYEAVQCRQEMEFLCGLTDAQTEILDRWVNEEFKRGLSGGRELAGYNRSEPPYEIAKTDLERCWERFAFERCVRVRGHEGHHHTSKGTWW